MPAAQTTRTERVTQAQPAAPGTAHPDPILAAKGWHANPRGIWTRRQEPQGPAAETIADREAGG
jgi:hypothetical protein